MKNLVVIFFCTIALNGFSQSIERQDLNVTGSSFQNGSFIVSQTVGGLVVSKADNSSFRVTQGFQQVNLGTTSLEKINAFNYEVLAYPNPTTEMVKLQIETEEPETFSIAILNVQGQQVAPLIDNLTINGKQQQQLNFSDFAVGNYIIQLTDSKGKVGIIQIIKN